MILLLAGKEQLTHLGEKKIGVELVVCEVPRAARAVIFVVQVSHDTRIAETVATNGEECILHCLETNRA